MAVVVRTAVHTFVALVVVKEADAEAALAPHSNQEGYESCCLEPGKEARGRVPIDSLERVHSHRLKDTEEKTNLNRQLDTAFEGKEGNTKVEELDCQDTSGR